MWALCGEINLFHRYLSLILHFLTELRSGLEVIKDDSKFYLSGAEFNVKETEDFSQITVNQEIKQRFLNFETDLFVNAELNFHQFTLILC